MKIAIAGFGFVGQAVFSCVSNKDECYLFDPPQGMGDYEDLIANDYIFCCLPTPTKSGTQDFSYYDKFFTELFKRNYSGILVVKSTVLYKNISPYLNKLNIVVNPEFLNQNNFHRDFFNQKMLVLGGRLDFCAKVADAYKEKFILCGAPDFEFCSTKEAIELKYAHNVYHAYKVLYWNYVHEVCDNQRKIFDMYSRLTGNTFEMARVCADGKPGYGGACFPKDVGAIEEERPHELTKFMVAFNKRLRGTDEV